MSSSLALHLTPDVVATLRRMFSVALQLPNDADVDDYLPTNPWGDMAAFRAQVYHPLHGQDEPLESADGLSEVVLDTQEVEAARRILDQLAESFTGGVGWGKPAPDDLRAVAEVASRLK